MIAAAGCSNELLSPVNVQEPKFVTAEEKEVETADEVAEQTTE